MYYIYLSVYLRKEAPSDLSTIEEEEKMTDYHIDEEGWIVWEEEEEEEEEGWLDWDGEEE